MREPNLEAMIEVLGKIGNAIKNSDSRFDIIEIIKKNSSNDISFEIEQIIYFSKDNFVNSTYDKIFRAENKKDIFLALVSFYPITKNLVLKMVKQSDSNPNEFLQIYDNNKEILTTIKENIDLIDSQTSSNPNEFNIYRRELLSYENKIETLSKSLKDLEKKDDDYKKEKLDLENKIKELEEKEKKCTRCT